MAASINHSHPRHDVPDAGPKMVNRLQQSKSPYVRDVFPREKLQHAHETTGPSTYEQPGSMASLGCRSYGACQEAQSFNLSQYRLLRMSL